jgi:glycogen synthase
LALGEAITSKTPYDVVHAHDWQASLVPVLLARMFRTHASLRRLPTVLTIHNLAYQGVFDASWLPHLGLGWELMRMDAMEYWGRISYLKGGIVFSRLITTVSPRYAQEIQTPELGFGFDGILRARESELVGILNGIDYDQWDPERDPNIPAPYNAEKLDGKLAAKQALLERFGLPFSGAAAPQSSGSSRGWSTRRVSTFWRTSPTSCRVWGRRSFCSAPASGVTRISGLGLRRAIRSTSGCTSASTSVWRT